MPADGITGITLDRVLGSDAAVFMGSLCRDYTDIAQENPHRNATYQATGIGRTMLANRVSYFFELKGSSVTVDTGVCFPASSPKHNKYAFVQQTEAFEKILNRKDNNYTMFPLTSNIGGAELQLFILWTTRRWFRISDPH